MPRTRVLVGLLLGAVLAAGAVVSRTVPDERTVLGSPKPVRQADTAFATSQSPADASGAAEDSAGAVGGGMQAQSVAAPAGGSAVRIARTAAMQISVQNAADRVARRVPAIAARLGGHVAEARREGEGADLRATYTLRVPADRFDTALAELASLGEVRDESQSGRDVTGQLVDYEARLRSMRAEEEALRAILGKASSVADTLQVTQALAGVRGRIEQLDAERARLADSADMATIDVTVAGPGAALAEPVNRSVLEQSVARAAGAALAVVGGTVVVLGAAIPLAMLGGLFLFGARVIARRRHQVAEPAVG